MSDNKNGIKEYAGGWITERKNTEAPGFLKVAFPIIGPPLMSFAVPSGAPPQAAMSCDIGVPTRTRKLAFLGSLWPVMVTTRSKSGLFFCTAS